MGVHTESSKKVSVLFLTGINMSNVHVYMADAICRFHLDHAHSNLIWNLKTREELRDALEGEMRSFNIDRELGSTNVISWNHQEFEVSIGFLDKKVELSFLDFHGCTVILFIFCQ